MNLFRTKSGMEASDIRCLVVEVVEARNLIACTKTGDSDPNLHIFLTDLGAREIKTESFRTRPQTKTLAPKWRETFTFGKKYNLDTDGDLPILNVVITHKAGYSVADVPMGEVQIDLHTIDPNGATTELWYPLALSGRMKHVTGEVLLKLNFTRGPTVIKAAGEEEADLEVGGAGAEEKGVDSDNDAAEEQPNELHITVVQGRRLEAKDHSLFGTGTSDPQVRLKIHGFEQQKTPYIRKTLDPVWNSRHVFPAVVDSALSLSVIVEDHNDLKGADFMGKISIPLGQFNDKKPSKKWYKLRNKNMDADGIDRGEVELLIHWKFNIKVLEDMTNKRKAYESSAMGKLANLGSTINKMVGREESESEPESDDELDKLKSMERPKTEEEKADEKKKEEETRKELADIEIKDGDYQVQVHIIEARELKAENLDGTSDPVVYVECFGQKQNTICIKQVTSCVFDELLIFNMKDLDKETFADGLIRIAVYDANSVPFAGNTMIGAYAIDASMVYSMNKYHEMYRAWVPLMDDEDPDDVGVQGYLKISIQIIGPGEKIRIHDEQAELAAEIKRENAAGGDIGSLLLTTPTIRKEWKYVVASIYKCEGLPVMDGKVGMGPATLKQAGTDAFCKLGFAGGKPIKTKVVTRHGTSRSEINPEFNYELWYPVSVPTMTQVVRFSVWDKDPTESELIGQVVEKYNRLDRLPGCATDVQWYNMYGAHEFKNDKLLTNIKKGAVAMAKAAQQTMGNDIDWREYYNNVPEKASAFKGRCLMKFRIESKRPEKYDKPEVQPFKRRVKPLKRTQEPATLDYILQALVISGVELPSFGTITSHTLRVRIAIGQYELSTRPAKYEGGQCRWNEFLISEKFAFPADVRQIPDIFIYLVREDMKPVCFTRMPAVVDPKENKLLGFEGNAEWYLLREDKSIDALSSDVFPGNVLLKIGFGLAAEAERHNAEWKRLLEASKKATPYQVRVHLYQGRDLPAADANGLCDPYVVCNLAGKKEKTKTIKKNRYPGWYETLCFEDVMIPEYNNFEYATQLTFRLFDYDFDGDDYLGTCCYNLQDAIVSNSPDDPLPIPSKWLEFFYEVPGDSQGELLVMVQLIPTLGRSIPKPIRNGITPATRKAFIELVLIGVRDMAPYNFQSMTAPFLEIELNSFGTSYLSTTAPSKRPEPENPNFLEKIMMPVQLPEHSIFASPLQVRARDTRLGGWLKPVVGVCQIDLTSKIPWCEDTYVPPQTDIFYQPETDRGSLGGLGDGVNAVEDRVGREEAARLAALEEDDFIAMPEPMPADKYIRDKLAAEDTGAGVFGALHHIDASGNALKKSAGDAFVDPDWSQDDGDQPPAWSIGRHKLESELEVELKTTPFETYPLMRGQKTGSILGDTLKVVGRLKGLVRIIEDEKEPPMLPEELMKQLMKPEKYVVRLYCLTGKGLAAMDVNMAGQPANSDPYLKVKLGKEVFNDRENYVEDVKDVDLYKMVPFNCELPGTSQLQISLMDADLIGSDDLIGKTTIDLEDRWFDSRWQKWGEENVRLPGSDPNDPTKVRWQTKPIERRSLYVPSKSMPQGVLEMWVDIMKPEVATAFPPDDVSLPPTQMFEVRVVIWKCKNVPPMDTLEGMSDLFVKCWPEGCQPAETDTHWRAKKGKASFNWRLLFDVELGHSTRAMKFPYLHLQLWDRDILKWNDCAGEGTINLGRYYRKAYKRNVALKLFETKKGAAAKRAAKSKDKFNRLELMDTEEDIPHEEDDEEVQATGGAAAGTAGAGAGAAAGAAAEGAPRESISEGDVTRSPLVPATTPTAPGSAKAPASPTFAPMSQLLPPRQARDSDDEDSDDDYAATANDDGLSPVHADPRKKNHIAPVAPLRRPNKKQLKKLAREKAAKEAEERKRQQARSSWFAFWRKEKPKVAKLDVHGNPVLDEDGQPVMVDEGEEHDPEAGKTEEEKKEEENDELKSLITSFKNMTGLWDIDPEDSAWYHLEQKDKNDPSIVIPMGSICYSVQIWPKDKALVMQAGAARSEPNSNPFCPPPVGRFKFSWNPFVLGSELCGPALCAQFFCCLLCAAFIVLMIFCQPFLNIIINLIFVVY